MANIHAPFDAVKLFAMIGIGAAKNSERFLPFMNFLEGHRSVTKWEAIAEIVKSFNARGSPKLALVSLLLMIGLPCGAVAFAIWHGAPAVSPAIETLATGLLSDEKN